MDVDLTDLASRVQRVVRQDLVSMYSLAPRVPEYAGQLSTDVAVHHVLTQAQGSLSSLRVPANVLLETSVEELAVVWAQLFRNHYGRDVLRNPPNIQEMTFELAAKVVSGIFQSHRNAKRYASFLQQGAPPGVRSFPVNTRDEKKKSDSVPFEWRSPGGASQRFELYRRGLQGRPQRRMSLRASSCAREDYEALQHAM